VIKLFFLLRAKILDWANISSPEADNGHYAAEGDIDVSLNRLMGSMLMNFLIGIFAVFYLIAYNFWPWRKQVGLALCLIILVFTSSMIGMFLIQTSSQSDIMVKNIPAPIAGDSQENLTSVPIQKLAFEEGHDEQEMVVHIPRFVPSQGRNMPENVERAGFRPASGQKLWQYNAAAQRPSLPGQAKITIVIDDLGLLKDRTRKFIEMNAPLTLSFLPYAPQLPQMTKLAQKNGHELMVHMPMEPKGNDDPGPYALRSGLSAEEQLFRLNYNLSRFDGYVGINNHMGSAFTEDTPAVQLLLDSIRGRGLLVLDSKTSNTSVLSRLASQKNIPNVSRDVFLDNVQDINYILRQLKNAETIARLHGQAIAIGHPYAQTIEALNLWLPTLKEKNIALVPLSQIVKDKYDRKAKNKNLLAGKTFASGEGSSVAYRE